MYMYFISFMFKFSDAESKLYVELGGRQYYFSAIAVTTFYYFNLTVDKFKSHRTRILEKKNIIIQTNFYYLHVAKNMLLN